MSYFLRAFLNDEGRRVYAPGAEAIDNRAFVFLDGGKNVWRVVLIKSGAEVCRGASYNVVVETYKDYLKNPQCVKILNGMDAGLPDVEYLKEIK
jgi:hypothetical protein